MKKVLLAFDELHFSAEVTEFAKQLNAQDPIWATGLFLPSIDYVELLYSYGGVLSGPMYVTEIVKQDEKILNDNIALFKSACESSGIQYNVDTNIAKNVTSNVGEKTRFADLLVLSSKLFYENLGSETREEYIADVLHKAECPVMLIPDHYTVPKSIIMAYDGSEQSLFAIKQFTYLFPNFKDVQVLLAYFDKGDKAIPEREQIDNYLSLHYKNVTVFKLKLGNKKDLEKWVEDNGATVFVAGAHGRSMLSEMFRDSFISEVIHQHKVPVFVAHK